MDSPSLNFTKTLLQEDVVPVTDFLSILHVETSSDISTQFLFDKAGKVRGMPFDLGLVLAFEHHAHLGLGAGVAHEDAAPAFEGLLHLSDPLRDLRARGGGV